MPTLFILREESGIEYEFPVEIERNRDGEIVATVAEDVAEKCWTTRRGGLELEETGDYLFAEGDVIELTDDENEEAEEILAAAAADFANHLKDIMHGGRTERQENN